MDVVVGAKWSGALLPEVFYPASARLCVQTTANLVVYRVARLGAGRVEVSRGIGIACCRGGVAGLAGDTSPPDGASGSCPAPGKRARPTAASLKAEVEEDGDVAVSQAPPPKRARRSRTTAAQGSSDDEESKDADTAASATHTSVLDYVWLDNDDLVVLTTQGLHVVSFYGDLCDDDAPQLRDLPPPVYTWGSRGEVAAMGFAAPTPVCFAAVSATGLAAQINPPFPSAAALAFVQRTLVVASPFLLRVLHVAPTAALPGSPVEVQLVHFMEVPWLQSVPSAVCAVAAELKRASNAVPSPASLSSPPPADAAGVEVVVFVAAPCLVLRGRFVLSTPLSTATSSSCVATWATDAKFGAEQLVGEVCLREFCVSPLSAEVCDRENSHLDETAALTDTRSGGCKTVCTSVLGIGDRTVFQYLLTAPSTVALLQCPLLAARTEMPMEKCAGIVGVALHPSAALAVVAVQSGRPRQEPFHLWLTSVDGVGGAWLRRFIDVTGMVRGTDDAQDAKYDNASDATGGDAYNCGGARWATRQLLVRQVGDSYFLRERLFPGMAEQVCEWQHYDQQRHAALQMPSSKTLRRLRSLALAKAAAVSPLSLVADLGLRHAYLQLRAQHGVALFLRWPLPSSTTGVTERSGGGSNGSSLAATAVMAARAMSWPWWRLLRHVWATCPWDTPVLLELVLSNAVCILAKRFHYANMAFGATEQFRESGTAATSAIATGAASACTTDPLTVDVDGAWCYVEAYVRHQEEVLRQASQDTAAESNEPRTTPSTATVLTAADCALSDLRCASKTPVSGSNGKQEGSTLHASQSVHWCVSAAWVATLNEFLACVARANKGRAVASQAPHTADASSTASESPPPPPSHLDHVRFPCSLCDRTNAAPFRLSLSSTSRHIPFTASLTGGEDAAADSAQAVSHTTLFSGTTFSPLSFFAPDYVLTRCESCGLSDYANGPLCRVCGGLLE